MMTLRSALIGALVLTLTAQSAQASNAAVDTRGASVLVMFESPEQFTDASHDRHLVAKSRAAVLNALTKEFERLGTRYLASGNQLSVTVADLDLAGRFDPALGFAYDHVRVHRSYTAPRIQLSYVLKGADGSIVSSANDVVVRGRGYLDGSSSGLESDPLRYDKAMLQKWFRRTFASAGTHAAAR